MNTVEKLKVSSHKMERVTMFKYILTFLWEFIMDKKNDQTSKSGVGKKIIIFALIAGSFTINYVAINRLYAVSKAHIELSKKFKEIVANKKDLDQCRVKLDTLEKIVKNCMK